MLIEEGDNFLELIVIERIPHYLPAPGDVQFKINIQSYGFVGQGSTWVAAPNLERFITQMQALEARRQGGAELTSISPGQFQLRIFSTDSLGHMALSGRLSSQEGQSGYQHHLAFGFDFEPSKLLNIVR